MVGWVMRTFSRRYKFIMLTVCKALIQRLSQGLVTGYSLTFQQNERTGRNISVPPMTSNSPAAIRKAREASLQVKGARLFVQPGPQRTQEYVRGSCIHVQVWA
jgi:hypothetical protein